MNAEEVREHLENALRLLVVRDRYLFETDLSERCIAARLAMYLQPEFPDYHVDVEYTRWGNDPKRFGLPEECANKRDVNGESRVIPDMIVHRRGAEGPNILVLEMKKTTNRESRDCDHRRIQAFRTVLGYRFAALIECETRPRCEPNALIMEWLAD